MDVPDERYAGSLVSKLHNFIPEKDETELVKDALEHPIGTPRLSQLARGKRNIVILASDHTRPVPSKIIAPLLYRNPFAEPGCTDYIFNCLGMPPQNDEGRTV